MHSTFQLQTQPSMAVTFSLLLFLMLCITSLSSDLCKCLSRSTCSADNHQHYRRNLINLGPSSLITTYMSYFYFQPTQANYYRLTFNICILHNFLDFPLFSTSKLKIIMVLLKNVVFVRECQARYRRERLHFFFNQLHQNQAQRGSNLSQDHDWFEDFGKNDPMHYLNVSSNEYLSEESKDKKQNTTISDLAQQNISIQMKYETYVQTTYYGDLIIISTTYLLLLIFSTSSTIFEKKLKENQIKYIKMFMPVNKYGEKSCFFVSESFANCEEELQKVGEVDNCPICLNNFQQEDEIRTTPCRHRYHRECIDNWCGTNLSCPICRYRLDFSSQLRQIYNKFLRGKLIL